MDVETINICTNKVSLDQLLETHYQFTQARCECADKTKRLEGEIHKLKENLHGLVERKEKLVNWTLQKKLDYNKQRKTLKDVRTYFNQLSELVGYTISDNIIFHKELRLYKDIKCHYNRECYAVFEISSAGIINLIEIVPKHPNFDNIQQHFWNTQDSISLLSNLRKYFSIFERRKSSSFQN